MSSAAVARENGKSEIPPGRLASHVGKLDDLIGAHPDALRKIYSGGRPTDPGELGETPRGRLLALDGAREIFSLLKPVLRALGGDALPWKGKVFDHGGNAGQNIVLGKNMLRFRTERGPSDIDGRPTLVLLYDSAAFKNPWPVRAMRDELRTVAPGIAIGPAFMTIAGARRPLFWFGLEETG